METNPYIFVTGTVDSFNSNDHTFTMTPSQYIVLTHSSLPFPIHGHFANWDSKKRWGPEGPKVTVGTTITFGGLLQTVVCERNIDKRLEYAEIEVTTISYFGSHNSPARMSSKTIIVYDNREQPFLGSEKHAAGSRRRWNWDSLRNSSQSSQPSTSASPTKRKRTEEPDDNNVIKREKTVDEQDKSNEN